MNDAEAMVSSLCTYAGMVLEDAIDDAITTCHVAKLADKVASLRSSLHDADALMRAAETVLKRFA